MTTIHIETTLSPTIKNAIRDVVFERMRQQERWGDQNHNAMTWLTILGEEVGEAAQAALHDRFGGDHAGTIRAELVQVAAVAVQMIEAIDEGRMAP